MLTSSYTLSDLAKSFCAIALLLPFLLVPGYVIGWASQCFDFRALSFRSRQLISIPLSMALTPIVIYWAGTLLPWTAVCLLFGGVFAIWLCLLAGAWGHERPSEWLQSIKATPYQAWVIAALWLSIALLSLVDLQFGDRLYFSVTVYDHSVRTAITEAITRTGSRPANPFYFLTGPTPLRYHYFWFLSSGLLNFVTAGHIGARNFINASVVWCGWGLLSVVVLALRTLYDLTGAPLKRRSLLAIAFFAVTGLDLLPTAYFFLRHGRLFADMEWWNDNQVTSWFGSVLWVPHHAAGLVIGLMGFLLCWDAALRLTQPQRIGCATLAGIALATLVGTSVYVAVVMGVFFVLWTVWELLRKDRRQIIVLCIAGIVALAIVLPYLKSLTGPGEGGAFVRLAIRRFWIADRYATAHGWGHAAALLFRLALTPLNYFLELGFFFVVGVAYVYRVSKNRTFTRSTGTLMLLAGTALCICTFVRSGVIDNNDLGMRGFLPIQFVLLLWSAELFDLRSADNLFFRFRPRWMSSTAWAMLLVIGTAGTFYELGMLRFNSMLADAGFLPTYFGPDRNLGKRTFALRRAYEVLARKLPADAVIQNNPEWKYTDFFYGLYADRQTAAYDNNCGTEFGGDPRICAKDYPALLPIFVSPDELGAGGIQQLCQRFGISALILKDLDEGWKANPSWAAGWTPVVSNDYARIFLVPRSTAIASKAPPNHE